MMLGDEHEATRLVLLRMKDVPVGEVFDKLLIPTAYDTGGRVGCWMWDKNIDH